MEVLQGTNSLPVDGVSSVTIGFFDGVHLGHQAVIRRTVELAGEKALHPTVVTFDRHPLQTLSPGKVPPLLSTLRKKAELIEGLAVGRLFVLEFTDQVSRWTPETFVDRILVRGLNARHVVVGANFTFGHRAAGNVGVLTDLGADLGFAVEGVDLFTLDGRRVSSTSIREALAEGDLDWPERALGRRYSVEGTVVPGAGRGRDLGFPTANLRTPAGIQLPGRGVYAGRAGTGGRWWKAAINVGINPTFGEEPLHVEAHLLDFDGAVSDSVLTVEFWVRLRDEVRFDSSGALARQMGDDVQRTRELVGS